MNAAQLRDEIALREASLADAARELAAGELDQASFDAIVARERAALDKARAALRDVPVDAPVVTRAPRRRKTSRLVVGLACIALAATGFTVLHLSLRQAGNSVTGGVQVNQSQLVSQLLIEGQADAAANNNVAALAAYQHVLRLAPHNITALTEAGWLEFSAGSASGNVAVVTLAEANLREAVRLAPSQAAPHLYYALVAYVTPHNMATARKQFQLFVAAHPSAVQLAVATPYLRRLHLKF
jgi:tetratricopeptide (TPR) repeat protein